MKPLRIGGRMVSVKGPKQRPLYLERNRWTVIPLWWGWRVCISKVRRAGEADHG